VPRPAIERFARDRLLGQADLVAFCLGLYDATLEHQPDIDPKLTATAANWRLSRMHPADRNVLRLATYELLFDPAAQPVEVVLNEAIELARRFGSKDSAAFVNGVLDKVAKMRNAEPATRNEATSDQTHTPGENPPAGPPA
jgi:N utilization substance protein B